MTGLDPATLLALAMDLADRADSISLPAFRSPVDVRTKADGTPVTQVDLDVERAVRSTLRARRPDHAFLGEEDGLEGDPDAPRWIVDPIDGTRSYLTGNPLWATLVACEIDGRTVASVVSAPAFGVRWCAAEGLGATRNGRSIGVSTVDRLDQAQVSFGDLQSFEELDRPDILTSLTAATVRQRGYGDFWGFCLVAEGIIDVCVEGLASHWDLAATRGLIEAAGGRFTDLDGAARADGGGGVATNGLLHDAVLAHTR